ncbi:MAG: hypothetical protein JJE04_19085 [Acidobacteriia bacterium]|nr:hypothetical protein [Terriglobia bacterium]
MLRKAAPLLLALSQFALCYGEQYFPPLDEDGGWRLGSAGIDTAKLDEAFQYTQQTSQHGGLLVVHHG